MRRVRVGTRTSKLAVVQTRLVTDLLKSRFPTLSLETVPMSTLGDRLPLERRAAVEGKAAFTQDIERALLDGTIDMAVHSMKDMSGQVPDGLAIGATPLRGDPSDALVPREPGKRLPELKRGAVIGTSSVRRKAQLLAMRSDLSVVDLHGNVDTRLSRLEGTGLDGIVIAAAGLQRLGEAARVSQFFAPEELTPAPAQGAIAVEIREEDEELAGVLSAVDDRRVRAETTSERSFASALGVDCDIPAGALATLEVGGLRLTASIVSPDGRRAVRGTMNSPQAEAARLGRLLAADLLARGGDEILGGRA